MNARAKIDGSAVSGDKFHKRGEIEGAGSGRNVDRRTIAHFDGWTDFLLSVRGLTEGTVSRYRRLVERLVADVGKPFAQVTRADVERHLRRLHVAGRGESVRQGVVVAVRSLGEWCLAHGLGGGESGGFAVRASAVPAGDQGVDGGGGEPVAVGGSAGDVAAGGSGRRAAPPRPTTSLP